MTFQTVLNFWFQEISPEFWFKKDPNFDRQVRDKFESTFQQILDGKLSSWKEAPQGRLALILVLDQFSRNMFRNQAQAFSGDALALKLAQEGIANGDDQKLSSKEKSFFYMPFMHSEESLAHEEALKLFAQPGLEDQLKYEKLHKKIIDRFGRYPHRNEILGRESTPEEIEFLKTPNSSF